MRQPLPPAPLIQRDHTVEVATITIDKSIPDKEEWAIQRKNLLNFLEKYPNQKENVIDSAYLAGLGSVASQSKSIIEEVRGMKKETESRFSTADIIMISSTEKGLIGARGYNSALEDIISLITKDTK